MGFVDVLKNAGTIALGLYIFVISLYLILQILTSEGFNRLWSKDETIEGESEEGFEEEEEL